MPCPVKTAGCHGRQWLPRGCVWLDPKDRWDFSGETEGNADGVSESQPQEARGPFRELPGLMELGEEALSWWGLGLWNKETAGIQMEESGEDRGAHCRGGCAELERRLGVLEEAVLAGGRPGVRPWTTTPTSRGQWEPWSPEDSGGEGVQRRGGDCVFWSGLLHFCDFCPPLSVSHSPSSCPCGR